jgi:ribosome maturation factor RimP
MKTKKRYNTPKCTPDQVQVIEEHVLRLAEAVVPEQFFIVAVAMVLENGRWYLRIYIECQDSARGISLEDCRILSDALGDSLEEKVSGLSEISYNLEISSPGLFRKLETTREFTFYKGRRVEITIKPEKPFFAFLQGWDDAAQGFFYTLSKAEGAEIQCIAWNPKTVMLTLAPELNIQTTSQEEMT